MKMSWENSQKLQDMFLQCKCLVILSANEVNTIPEMIRMVMMMMMMMMMVVVVVVVEMIMKMVMVMVTMQRF